MTARRVIAVGVLGAAVIVVAALVLLGGSGSYVLHAHFLDAGQLVTGDRVEIGGVPVGTVSDEGLTSDGQASVKLSITDGHYTPLHAGTRAQIRAPGLAGVANRYVDLQPGPSSEPKLHSGAVLGTADTNGIVDIDELLDSFDPRTRTNLQQLIGRSSQIFAGSGARYFNQLLGELSPAFAQTSSLTGQLTEDRVGLTDLIRTADTTATALASRQREIRGALANSAQALSAVAREQQPLADALTRAPSVLSAGTHTLSELQSAITTLRPTLRAVPAAAQPLAADLRQFVPTATTATPVLAKLVAAMPSLERSLRGFAPLAPVATRALGSTSTALKDSLTILTGLRYYGADLLLGVTNGLGGLATGNYDVNGHYARVEFVNAPQSSEAGILAGFVPNGTLLPGEFGVREHLSARCPGGDAPPAPDGSNPWILSSFWCNPSDDVPLSVDTP
jgi:phospholipid/cholesterol/gamma-HCH transport system substrate-binding protein